MSEKKVAFGSAEPLWSRKMHARAAELGLPLAGNFELTTRCNFNCRMCYVHNNKNHRELSAKEWLELGEQAARNGMIFLLLTGGEPFVREDFWEIYTGLKKLGLMLSINTNGSLIDEAVLERLVKDPPLRLNVSLYGAGNESYRRLCGQAKYDTVVNNLRNMCQAGLQVKLNASITPDNVSDLAGIYAVAEELNVHVNATTYMFPPVRVNGGRFGEAPHRFSAEEAAKYMLQCREQRLTPEQLAHAWVEEEDFDGLDCMDGQGDHMRCRAGKSAFWVTWDGRMLPCGMFPGEGYRVAEIGFDQAWERVKADCGQLRMPAACTACHYRDRCSVCAAACMTETGATDRRPDYICRMTEQFERLTKEKYGHIL